MIKPLLAELRHIIPQMPLGPTEITPKPNPLYDIIRSAGQEAVLPPVRQLIQPRVPWGLFTRWGNKTSRFFTIRLRIQIRPRS